MVQLYECIKHVLVRIAHDASGTVRSAKAPRKGGLTFKKPSITVIVVLLILALGIVLLLAILRINHYITFNQIVCCLGGDAECSTAVAAWVAALSAAAFALEKILTPREDAKRAKRVGSDFARLPLAPVPIAGTQPISIRQREVTTVPSGRVDIRVERL